MDNYNLEMAKYIWSILKTESMIVASWGLNPETIKVIDHGIEFHVQGFKHTGKVQIVLNEGKDLFEIYLIPDSGEKQKTTEDIFVEDLVSVIDRNVELADNYEKRVSQEYGFFRD